MDDNQKAMYNGICQCRNNQITLRWSISQLFVVINLGGLSFLGTQPVSFGAALFLGAAGFIVNLLWFFLNQKSQQWVVYWNDVLAQMDPPKTDVEKFRVFSGKAWDDISQPFTFHHYLNLISFVFVVAWVLGPFFKLIF